MPPITLKPGVWGVLTTPFTGSTLDVDVTSLAALAEHYERAGANGFTVLGVFGEAAQLDTEERRTVLQTVAEATSLPLVVGSTSLGTAPVAEEARLAQQVLGDRMAAVMVQVNSPNPVILTNHLRAVHERTGAGIVVQDYPWSVECTSRLRRLPGRCGTSRSSSRSRPRPRRPPPPSRH